MEPLEIKLHDFSKMEFRWIHAGLLSIERWVQGNEYSPTDWLLTGCVVLGGADLERFLSLLQSPQEDSHGTRQSHRGWIAATTRGRHARERRSAIENPCAN
jgi:hypothetical protein